MNTLLKRSITATVYGIVVLGCALAGRYTFALLGLSFIAVAMSEFFSIQKAQGLQPMKWTGMATGMLLFLACYLWIGWHIDSRFFLLFIVIFLGVVSVELFRDKQNPFGNIGVFVLGLVYIALPLSLMSALVMDGSNNQYSASFLLYIFIQIWAFDTGAYLSGVSFGKHKLSPRLSPNKSWEGVVGGMVTVIVAALMIARFYRPFDTEGMVVSAVLVALGATVGDLAESMLKRSAGVKDSGKLLPGHGGLLDRIDSLLFVVPLLYVFLLLYKK